MKLAAERAGWWAQHLGKLRDPAYADLVAHLHAFARESTDAMFGLACDLIPGVDRLADLLRQAPLAERAAGLLRLLLEAQTTPLRVPWVMMDNRPVLRPIAHLAYVCKEAGKWDRFMELARWLVLELNPNDNHGLRWDLSYALMRHGRDQDALALGQLFPNEVSPTLDLNRALAHFRLGDLAQAQADLRQAKLDHSKALAMLQKPHPKPVKADAWGVAVGGAFEAWLYVEPHRPLWEQSGALVWAAQALKK